MRVGIYNQMFGLDGRSFWKNIAGHWTVHFQSNEQRIWKRVSLKETINLIKKSKADVLGICEIMSAQQQEFTKLVGEIGYKYVYFSYGHKLKHHNLYVTEAIISKYPCKKLRLSKWPVENICGGGGGFGGVYIPKIKTTFYNVHLALPGRKYFYDQLKFVNNKIKNTKGKVILVGDFNLSYQKIRNYFSDLNLASGKIKSCSMTPIMKLVCHKDFDHIFMRGFEKEGFGEITGKSDHKLIWADLK